MDQVEIGRQRTGFDHEAMSASNWDYLVSKGVEAETWHRSGVLALHVPQSEEALITSLVYALCVSADALFDTHRRPDSLTNFAARFTPHPTDFGSEYRPARANMAVGLRRFTFYERTHPGRADERSHFTITFDNRNAFEDKARRLREQGESDLRYRSRPSQVFARVLEHVDLADLVTEIETPVRN